MNRKILWLLVGLLCASTAHARPTANGGQAYIDECRAAGVPIPPAWASGGWLFEGPLPNPFISRDLNAEVYSFTAPQGICIALPRFRPGTNTIELLGIICQGKVSGNACFWDNSRNKQQFEVGRNEFVPLLGFSGGADLDGAQGGTCTGCHAGENAFIVHPGTALDLGDAILKPNVWHTPIVAAAWPDNPGPSNLLEQIPLAAGDGSCLTCHGAGGHRFPQVSTELSGFCGELNTAVTPGTGTMPPGSPGNAAYMKHITALKTACMMPPPAPPTNPPERMLTPAELDLVLD